MSAKPIPNLKEFNFDQVSQSITDTKSATEELKGLHVTLAETVDKLQNDVITKAEFAERTARISEDLEEIAAKIEMSDNAKKIVQERPKYLDYRHMLSAHTPWLIHDNKIPYNKFERKAYALFQIECDFANMANGSDLLNLRNLHDAVLIYDVQNRHVNMHRGNYQHTTQTGIYQALVEGVREFDPDLADAMKPQQHAMAGGNTGFGLEWVPTDFSSEFNAIARIQPTLSNKFPWWMMAPSASGYFPFQEGKATVYKASESLVDNADQLTKTNIATGRKLFTPTVFAAALISSEELVEDSLIDMVSFIRQELAVSTSEGLDSAIINGDSTSPHQDNAETDKYASNSVETIFKGLRRIAVDDSNTVDIETLSASTGVGALEIANFQELEQMMGVLGARDPREIIWVSGIRGRGAGYNALLKEDALGTMQYIISGVLPTILGHDFHASGQYLEAQESDGLGGDDSDHTSITGVHLPSFRVATRRNVTLEMDKDILTQQRMFVSTARYDFGKVASTTLDPVVVGYNVEWIA